MAISRMIRITVAGRKDDWQHFIARLQAAAIFHVVPVEKTGGDESSARTGYDREAMESLPELKKIQDLYAFLQSLVPPPSFWEKITSLPSRISLSQYLKTGESPVASELVERGSRLVDEYGMLQNSIHEINRQLEDLSGWEDVAEPVTGILYTGNAVIQTGLVDPGGLDILENNEYCQVQLLKDDGKKKLVAAAALNRYQDKLQQVLGQARFQRFSLPAGNRPPSEVYGELTGRLRGLKQERKTVENDIRTLLKDIRKLEIVLEYYINQAQMGRVVRYWLNTASTTIMNGWVREQDMEAFDDLAGEYSSIEYEYRKPSPGERPPVALTWCPPFAPFQLITRLYNMPSYGALDPGPLVSVFFAVFFGICLTDAGYGVLLCMLAAFGLWKLKTGRDLLWIIFWGGLCTILAGVLTGGFFGDLFRVDDPFIAAPFIADARESMMWFDPMREPMTFFRLVLALGVVQILAGLAAGVVSNLKLGRLADAIVDNMTWLVMVCSLLVLLFSTGMSVKTALVPGDSPPLGESFRQPAVLAIITCSVIIVAWGARSESSLFFRFFIGFLKLVVLSGVFSYLGDVLSYIRLMALGMVTAGIAMAVNAIAFMVYDIPVAGIVLTGLILVVGHLFNMAINVLGGFVHTLRLQYVEFFSKFFTGGGEKFSPLAYSGKYAIITDTTGEGDGK